MVGYRERRRVLPKTLALYTCTKQIGETTWKPVHARVCVYTNMHIVLYTVQYIHIGIRMSCKYMCTYKQYTLVFIFICSAGVLIKIPNLLP